MWRFFTLIDNQKFYTGVKQSSNSALNKFERHTNYNWESLSLSVSIIIENLWHWLLAYISIDSSPLFYFEGKGAVALGPVIFTTDDGQLHCCALERSGRDAYSSGSWGWHHVSRVAHKFFTINIFYLSLIYPILIHIITIYLIITRQKFHLISSNYKNKRAPTGGKSETESAHSG